MARGVHGCPFNILLLTFCLSNFPNDNQGQRKEERFILPLSFGGFDLWVTRSREETAQGEDLAEESHSPHCSQKAEKEEGAWDKNVPFRVPSRSPAPSDRGHFQTCETLGARFSLNLPSLLLVFILME